jgi:DNA-binding transcriptional LysR family regulator
MEMRHLRYFIAVAENLSFRRAAERLHLTRPALSKQVKELEEELGVRLLDRTTARVTLTVAGEVYLRESREVLAQAERAATRAREASAGRLGVLHIGDMGMLGADLLQPVLRRFRTAYPNVEVALQELPLPRQVEALLAREIHLGFALREQIQDRPGLRSFPVRSLRVGVALSKDHPLAASPGLSLHDVLDQPLLCIGDGRQSDHARHIRTLLKTVGADQKPIRVIGSLPSLLTMLSSGLGVSFLPEVLANSWPGLAIVPINGPSAQIEFELHAAWRKDESSAAVRNFVRILRRHAL